MKNSLVCRLSSYREIVKSHNIARKVITVILLAIELVICLAVGFDNLLMTMNQRTSILSFFLPSGVVLSITYYIVSPFFVLLYASIKERLSYKSLLHEIDTSITDIKKWLFSQKVQWAPYAGAVNYSTDHRIANMLEIGSALAGLDLSTGERKKLNSVNEQLWSEKSNRGWYSRTLGKDIGEETVICTSWGLAYFKNKAIEEAEFFHSALDNLWSAHSECGWGLYVRKHPESECRTGNTFWALRTINYYLSHGYQGDQESIREFIVDYYRKSKDGRFGFHLGDDDNLCATAMFYVLYNELDKKVKNEIKNYYNSKEVIEYILEKFCKDNTQCIEEDLPGTKKVDKVPWQHITVSYALIALSYAWRNKELNMFQKTAVVKQIRTILAMNVQTSNTGRYYHPQGMSRCANHQSGGAYTYPSAHLIIGLHAIKKTIEKSKITA